MSDVPVETANATDDVFVRAAEIKARTAAAACRAHETWAYKVRLVDATILNPLAENAEEWSADMRKIATHSECLGTLTDGPGEDDEAAAKNDRNLRMVLKTTMNEDIWPHCDLSTAAQCFSEAIALGSKPELVLRKLVAAARATVDVRAYILEDQNFAARIKRLD